MNKTRPSTLQLITKNLFAYHESFLSFDILLVYTPITDSRPVLTMPTYCFKFDKGEHYSLLFAPSFIGRSGGPRVYVLLPTLAIQTVNMDAGVRHLTVTMNNSLAVLLSYHLSIYHLCSQKHYAMRFVPVWAPLGT